MSMIETIAAMIVMSVLIATLTSLSGIKSADMDSVDQQYKVLAVDAWLADIYDDFHSCLSYSFEETPAGNKNLVFIMRDGSSHVYGFDQGSGYCTFNGARSFEATRLTVEGAGNVLIVSVKLPEERLLEMNIYK